MPENTNARNIPRKSPVNSNFMELSTYAHNDIPAYPTLKLLTNASAILSREGKISSVFPPKA